jgi:hypothetical protein
MPPRNLWIVAELLGKHGPTMLLLCLLTLSVVAVCLAIVDQLLRDIRTAARRQRESDVQDEARLANRLSGLAHREQRTEEGRD